MTTPTSKHTAAIHPGENSMNTDPRPFNEQRAVATAAYWWAFPWPEWRRVAQQLHDHDITTGPRPHCYDVEALRDLHTREPSIAMAVARRAGGWSVCPRDAAEFDAVLAWWQDGHDPADLDDEDDPEGHFVGVERVTFSHGANKISIAHCQDCGIPVWTRGLEYRLDRDPEASAGWRAIWPLDDPSARDGRVSSPHPAAGRRSTAISGRPEMPCAVPDVADDAEVPQ